MRKVANIKTELKKVIHNNKLNWFFWCHHEIMEIQVFFLTTQFLGTWPKTGPQLVNMSILFAIFALLFAY